MKILVIGSGGREHALVWKLRESQIMEEIYCAPGNAGIGREAECLPVDVASPEAILELATKLQIDLTVIGPEAPLVAGVVDLFEKAGLVAIGPTKAAARLEGSKVFSKQFMERHGIPTARFSVPESFAAAMRTLDRFGFPVVIKADGLAAGKGVVVTAKREEAERTLDEFMRQGALDGAGERVVIEECLVGEEVSFIVLTDGRGLLPLVLTQDHKAIFDGDQGPNTGGMGAYSDESILDERERDNIFRRVVAPTLAGLAAEGMPYRGFLYCGLMLTPEGPKVLEYNVRLGDPETQPILMRLRSDLVKILMAVHDGNLAAIDAHWTPNPAVCVVLASSGYPGKPETGQGITGFQEAEALGGVKVFHAGTTVRGQRLVASGGRVLGVTAIGEDLRAAIDRAYLAVSKIHFDGMQYRRDIGAKGLQRMVARPAKGIPHKPVGGLSTSGIPS